MKKLKTLLSSLTLPLALALSIAPKHISAQDIHFSQFYMTPTLLNPAMTGLMNCNHRISANYRNQWASVLRDKAFQTAAISYDARIPAGRYDYFGLGGTIWNDRAGSLNLSSTQIHLTGSYSKRMGGYRNSASYLVVGVDVGVAQRGLNLAAARFGSQNDGGVFNQNIASGEVGLLNGRDNYIYPDVSAGLMWFSVIDDNFNWYVGGAYSHINRANQSFTTTEFVPLPSKFTFHFGGEFPMSDRVSLLPGVVTFLQGPYFQTNTGTSLKFVLGSSRRSTEALQFGLWARLANYNITSGGSNQSGILIDAIIPSIRFDYNNSTIGFSYDVNTSSLRAASGSNGGFEFAFQYKICGSERRKVYCPTF